MEKKITGIMIYYYHVCTRKLWYFYNDITMESFNEDVELGKLIDENSYSNDEKHINIDNVINIDFIRSDNVLHEIKKSNKIENASIWQVKYYLYYLKKRGVYTKAIIDYPLLKKRIDVVLGQEDETYIESVIDDIYELVNNDKPPALEKKWYCKKCAYYELCYI